MDTAALQALIDTLRANGVTRYRGSDGTELELGAVEKPVRQATAQDREAADVQRRNQDIDDEWRHVGGAPPWIKRAEALNRQVDGDEDEPS